MRLCTIDCRRCRMGKSEGIYRLHVERDTSKAEDDLRRKREIEQLQAEKRRLVGELRALEDTDSSTF